MNHMFTTKSKRVFSFAVASFALFVLTFAGTGERAHAQTAAAGAFDPQSIGAQPIQISQVRCFSNGCYFLAQGSWPTGAGTGVSISGAGAVTVPGTAVPQTVTPQTVLGQGATVNNLGYPGVLGYPWDVFYDPPASPFGDLTDVSFGQASYICANGLRRGPSAFYADPCRDVGSVTVARGG